MSPVIQVSLFASLSESLLKPDTFSISLKKIVQNLNDEIQDSSSSLKCGKNSAISNATTAANYDVKKSGKDEKI
jgi:hypothetical protein